MWYLIPLALLYILINVLIWHRAVRLIRGFLKGTAGTAICICFTLIYAFLMSSVISWTLFSSPVIIHWLKMISNFWVGIFIYCLIFIISAEIVTFIIHFFRKHPKGSPEHVRFIRTRGVIVSVLIILFSVYGIVNWNNLRVTEYDVNVDKASTTGGDLKVVLIADTHIGYTVGEKNIRDMVELVNQQNPDLICFAGDIFDNDLDAMTDIEKIEYDFSNMKSRYGTYACYGNHDIYEKLVGGFSLYRMNKYEVQKEASRFLEASNINMLEDETVTVDGIQIVGRIDESKPNGGTKENKVHARKSISALTKDFDKSKLIIDIDHEPSQLDEKAAAGVDLDLCGHTHDGQIFPGNLTINLFWDNAYGLLDVGSMHSIVTSGVGVWGPAMRVGANPEIAVVNVHFTK